MGNSSSKPEVPLPQSRVPHQGIAQQEKKCPQRTIFPELGCFVLGDAPDSHEVAAIKAQILQPISEKRKFKKKNVSGNANSAWFYLGWQEHSPALLSSSSFMTP